MKDFTESDRYLYPLTKDSIVIDGGGFEGNFAKTIAEKYGCPVICYEPIKEFHSAIIARRKKGEIGKQVIPVHAGLGAYQRLETFHIKGDSTGIVAESDRPETVFILDINQVVDFWLKEFNRETLSLLKLNIEGMEMEVMEALLDSGYISRIEYLQVQPHAGIPDAEQRWNSICNRMLITHRLDYAADWIWYGWSSKELRR